MGMLMSLRVKTVTGLTLLPAVAALIAGITVGVTKLLATPDADKPTFINDFLWNPLSSSAAAAYATFIVVIFTIIIFQITRGASQSQQPETDRTTDGRQETVAVLDLELSEEEKNKSEHQRQLDRIRFAFTRNRRRMTDEILRIQRNGFLNLTIGILFSVIALGILGYPLFGSNNDAASLGWLSFAEHFAPRLSVGALVQFIGFFFLRLYVAGENESHYLRNEITNFESRMIAYHIAAAGKDTTSLRDVVKQLVRTERNFKLRKEEHALYEGDLKYNDIGEVITRAANYLKKGAGKKVE
jgi:hypothetical protein